MNGYVEQRAIVLAEYIVKTRATVRFTAKKFGISKSTVHKDVSQRLRSLSPELYKSVKEVLEQNKAERHLRGGIATKNKYLLLANTKNCE